MSDPITHQSGQDWSGWLGGLPGSGGVRIFGTKDWNRPSGVNPIKATYSTDPYQVNVFGKESRDLDLIIGFDERDTPLATALGNAHPITEFALFRGDGSTGSPVVHAMYKFYAGEGAGVEKVDDMQVKAFYQSEVA